MKQVSFHPTTTEHLNKAMESTTKIYVPKIPSQTTSADLSNLFSGLFPKQRIVDITIKSRYSGKYAFVKFQKDVVLPVERRVSWTENFWLLIEAAKDSKRHNPKNNAAKWNDKHSIGRREEEASTPPSTAAANRETNINVKSYETKIQGLNWILIENLPRQRTNLEDDITSFFRAFLPKLQIKKLQIERRSPAELFALIDFDASVEEVFGDTDSLVVPCAWATDKKLRLKISKKLAKKSSLRSNDKNPVKDAKSEDANEILKKSGDAGVKSDEYTNRYYSSLSKQPTGASTRTNDGLTNNKIFIRNLPRNTTRDQVARLFAEAHPDVNLRGIFISSNTGSRKFGFAFLACLDDMKSVLGDSNVTRIPCPWAKDVTLELEAGKKNTKTHDNGSNDEVSEGNSEEKSQTAIDDDANKQIEEDRVNSETSVSQKAATSEASSDVKQTQKSSSTPDLAAELAATKLLLEKALSKSSKLQADLELARKDLIPGTKAMKEVAVLRNELELTKNKLKESEAENSHLKENLGKTRKELETLRSDLAISELINSANSVSLDNLHSGHGFGLNLEVEAALSSGSGFHDQNEMDGTGSSHENSLAKSSEIEMLDEEDERQSAEKYEVELDLLRSLFSPEDLWLSKSSSSSDSTPRPTIHRRLMLPVGHNVQPVAVELKLTVPAGYSVHTSAVLGVEAFLDKNNTDVDDKVRQCIINSLPGLLATCQKEAQIHAGDDAIFFVIHSADAWLINDWKDIFKRELNCIK